MGLDIDDVENTLSNIQKLKTTFLFLQMPPNCSNSLENDSAMNKGPLESLLQLFIHACMTQKLLNREEGQRPNVRLAAFFFQIQLLLLCQGTNQVLIKKTPKDLVNFQC